MSRILFAWELGAGTGHLHSIGAVVAPLLKMGHEITLAVKNVVSARKVMGNLNVTILPAPFWQGQAKGLKSAGSYNEVLFHVGYLQTDDILALTESWQNLFRLCQAELVITEHSPTAMLASRTAGLPHFTLGTGFSLPPNRSPSPSLTPWIKTDPVRLQEGEKQALRTINSVLSTFDAKTLDSTADLFHQTPSFLLTLPELDHFGKRKDTAYWGNNISAGQTMQKPVWPGGKGEKVFVYIHPDYRQFGGLMKQLGESSHRCLVVAPGLDAVWINRLSTARLKIIPHQVDLNEVTRQCRVIINHASHGMMADVFCLGKPMLMLPNFTEQTVLAWQAARQSLGVMASPDPAKHNYKNMIEKLLDTESYFETATRFAEHYRDNPLHKQDLIDKIHLEIEAIL